MRISVSLFIGKENVTTYSKPEKISLIIYIISFSLLRLLRSSRIGIILTGTNKERHDDKEEDLRIRKVTMRHISFLLSFWFEFATY